jgi:Protein kinase domain
MAGRTKYKAGDQLGRWTLVGTPRSGGNGDVWRAESDEPPKSAAVKILHRMAAKDYERFRREVAICEELSPADKGILPVLEKHLPEKSTVADRAWFVMPLATDLTIALAGAPLDAKVSAIRDVARTLARLLAEHGINHRDVKPANLYQFENRIVVGDFGLAKRPSDPALTDEGKPLGPFHHLPSEVFVAEEEPDWERVDVYCLANTLWCIAAEKLHPPRGQIRAAEEDSLDLLLSGEPYVGQLAGVVQAATSRSPSSRPTLSSFADQLDDWLAARASRGDFAVEFEDAEARKLAVLRWLVQRVRSEPVFDRMAYEIPDDLASPSDVPGLTEGQMCEALLELIEDGAIEGEASYALGRREPRDFNGLYPTLYGIEEIDDLASLTEQAMPLLRAYVQMEDWLSLPKSNEPIEIAGLTLSPAEAHFQMRLLEAQGLLDFRVMHEGGMQTSFADVRTTSDGKRRLYQASRGAPN